jgi:hypothetical protein
MRALRLGSRSGTADPAELYMSLSSVDQLFNAPAGVHYVASAIEGGHFMTTGRLISGMEELVLELTPRRVRGGVRLTLELPADAIAPTTHDDVLGAIEYYCSLRLRQTDLEVKAQQREGLGALRIGTVLFAIGVALSYLLTRNTVPDTVQAVLGNGVFLLIAWLGLWYPLDLLVFLRRPLLRRMRVLRALEKPDLNVVAGPAELPASSSSAPTASPATQ